jgi:hypothetical protein
VLPQRGANEEREQREEDLENDHGETMQYLSVVRIVLSRGKIMAIERDELDFDAPAPVGHPGRLSLEAGHPTGPEVDERLPDFRLPDIHGRELTLHADRGSAKAVVVFFRSAVW